MPTKIILVAPHYLSGDKARSLLFAGAKPADDVGEYYDSKQNFCICDLSGLDHQKFNRVVLSQHAEIVVLVVDAVDGLKARDFWTKTLSALGGIPQLILAVDNMSLTNWSKERFELLQSEFNKSAVEFDGSNLTAVPVDFGKQELLRSPSNVAVWYQGAPLAETVLTLANSATNRPLKTQTKNSDQFAAYIHWLHDEPMLPGRHYLLKRNGVQTDANISDLKFRINSQTQYKQAAKKLNCGDIGYVNISLDEPIAFSPFEQDRASGSFELWDKQSGALAGICMIKHGLRRATNIHWQQMEVNKLARAKSMGQKPCLLWFTGLSGSGKSSIASLVEKKLHQQGHFTYALDGDNIRHGLCRDLGFTDGDRVENLRRISETAKLFVDAGMIVLASFIAPFRSERQETRKLFDSEEYLEIFVDTPLEICESRDVKGLYKLAREGKLKNFTGIDSPYETPEHAEINLAAGELSVEVLADQVIKEMAIRGLITNID